MKIVVGVDGSESSVAALRFAADEALATDGELVAVTVWEVPPLALGYVSLADANASMAPWLAGVVDETLGASGAGIVKVVETGSPSDALLRAAEGAGHLVVGSRGRGAFTGAILGSVSQQLANHTPCPLTVIPSPEETTDSGTDGPIVVGVDGSANSTAALRWAADRAHRLERTLRVAMAWRGEPAWGAGVEATGKMPSGEVFEGQARDMLGEVVEAAELPDSLQLELVLGEGAPAAVIRTASEGASMLVLGARGRGGFVGLLLGSVTGHMLNHLEAPTTVVPTP